MIQFVLNNGVLGFFWGHPVLPVQYYVVLAIVGQPRKRAVYEYFHTTMNGLWLGLNWLTWLTRYLVRDDSVNDDEDEGYDYPQLEVEHDEMHGLWWHSCRPRQLKCRSKQI